MISAKEYFEKRLEMPNKLGRTHGDCGGIACGEKCPLDMDNNGTGYMECLEFEMFYPDKAIEIVMNYKPIVDWSKVEKDTKVYVRNYDSQEWRKAYFCGYNKEKDYYTCYQNGQTEWTSDYTVDFWKQCKLAEE